MLILDEGSLVLENSNSSTTYILVSTIIYSDKINA